LNHNYPR